MVSLSVFFQSQTSLPADMLLQLKHSAHERKRAFYSDLKDCMVSVRNFPKRYEGGR